MNIHIRSPPSGISRFSAKKLIKSKKLYPNINTSFITGPLAKEQGIPIKNKIVDIIIVAFFLSILKVSITNATTTSSNDMADVNAANKINMKNKIPKNCPKGIESNTEGNVINMRLGPAPGSNPKANTAGNTANPARRATAVSIAGIITAFFSKFSVFPK